MDKCADCINRDIDTGTYRVAKSDWMSALERVCAQCSDNPNSESSYVREVEKESECSGCDYRHHFLAEPSASLECMGCIRNPGLQDNRSIGGRG
jgi:hypothetical protein